MATTGEVAVDEHADVPGDEARPTEGEEARIIEGDEARLPEGDEARLTEREEARITKGEDQVVLSKLAEGIFGLLGPAVNEIDDRVADVRKSQSDLKEQVDRLHDELKRIAEQKEVPHTLESYIHKLSNCRRRMHLVNELLKNIQERLNKLQQNVAKETSRKRVSLESTSYLSN